MNILIPHSWLKDYIKTNASVEEIAQGLSLHTFSVEKIEKVDDDYVYEIEVTPNRGDALSVLGVARELNAILPRLGFECEWVYKADLEALEGKEDLLEVEIKEPSLVPRFSAVVLGNIEVKNSPTLIQERLKKVGIRPINGVVDITNYLMIDKGQPMHVFDYDKIKGQKMVLRESKDGETLVTLDGMERELPEGVIVIEDGEKRLIDLCGIMGCANSEVDEKTKRVLLFVQVYDPQRIRKASMTLGHRTDAALRFEKGIDFEGVVPALWESVDFMKKYCDAEVVSPLIDIMNNSFERSRVSVDYEKINAVAGVAIAKEDIDKILTDLGFEIENGSALVPFWRVGDIAISEDLAEEVIRIYGYENLPSVIPTGSIPFRPLDEIFSWERTAKDYLKYQGFFECYSYSATRKGNVAEDAVPLKNALTEDFAFMRTSLIPQLLDVLNKNKGYADVIKLFEMAAVYLPKEGDLPDQPLMLNLVTKGVDYRDFKGYVEGLYDEMGLERQIADIRELPDNVLAVELDFGSLSKEATSLRAYTPLTGFNSIKEDMTFLLKEDVSYSQIEDVVYSIDPRVIKVEFKSLYKDSFTLGIEYLDREKQISSEDTQKIRKQIFEKLESELGVKLKT